MGKELFRAGEDERRVSWKFEDEFVSLIVETVGPEDCNASTLRGVILLTPIGV